eukprot:Skav222899  [mRNA]  locus=scaffold1489:18848:19700:+ [translate_table: standard]
MSMKRSAWRDEGLEQTGGCNAFVAIWSVSSHESQKGVDVKTKCCLVQILSRLEKENEARSRAVRSCGAQLGVLEAQVLRLQLQDHHGIMAGVAKLNVVKTEVGITVSPNHGETSQAAEWGQTLQFQERRAEADQVEITLDFRKVFSLGIPWNTPYASCTSLMLFSKQVGCRLRQEEAEVEKLSAEAKLWKSSFSRLRPVFTVWLGECLPCPKPTV